MPLLAKASLLGEVVSEHFSQGRGPDGIAAKFYSRATELNSTPWNLAAGFDFSFPQTRGERPAGSEERARYFAVRLIAYRLKTPIFAR